MGGCNSRKTSFNFIANDKGEIVAEEGSYIDYSALKDYYVVVEVYNSVLDKNEIYIARSIARRFRNNYSYAYINIFNNFLIVYDNNEKNTNLQYVKVTHLTNYLMTYDFVKYRYEYEDTQNLYELIKGDYKFENDKSISRKLTINNRL